MKIKAIGFVSVVVGALAVSVGVFGYFSPPRNADATTSHRNAPLASIGALLGEMAPGAVAARQADGSISVRGELSPSVKAEIQHARELADVHPGTIRCTGQAALLTCTVLPDSRVIPALKAGQKELYRRVIYRSISTEVTDRGALKLDSSELVCSTPRQSGLVSCDRVDRVQPVIAWDATLFVTYRPYHVTFHNGVATFHVTTNQSVPLTRAAP